MTELELEMMEISKQNALKIIEVVNKYDVKVGDMIDQRFIVNKISVNYENALNENMTVVLDCLAQHCNPAYRIYLGAEDLEDWYKSGKVVRGAQ